METKDIKDISDSKLVTSIYSDVASPAMKQIGQSVEGLLKFVALPFKFLGLTAEQLEKKYVKFIEEAVNRVPPEKLTVPKSSIVAPLLDYVKFCFADEPGNDLLRKMFSMLLSSSMNQDNASYLNKTYVETMRFLSWNEAKILEWCSDIIKTRHKILLSPDDITDKDIYRDPRLTSLTISNDEGKRLRISAGTPEKFAYANFPIDEALDLLRSLGLITIRRDYGIGYVLFEELAAFNSRSLSYELPPIFAKATSQFRRASGMENKGLYLNPLDSRRLKSEIEQINSIISLQTPKISVDRLLNMDGCRTYIYITSYGQQFLSCCT